MMTIWSTTPWFVFPVSPEVRIQNSFEGCSFPLHECLFTKLEICLPFSDFEVVMMEHFGVAPPQLHLGAWDFMKVFQL